MYQEALKKLNSKSNQIDALQVLINGLGELDPKVRDEFITRNLSSFIFSKQNNPELNYFLFSKLIGPKHLGIKGNNIAEVLMRSFSALNLGTVILTDNEMFQCLSIDNLNTAFEAIKFYLENETNLEEKSERYGWIHCFAHGGDALTTLMVHKKSNKILANKIIELIKKLFDRDDIKNNLDEPSKKRLFASIELGRIVHGIEKGEKGTA